LASGRHEVRVNPPEPQPRGRSKDMIGNASTHNISQEFSPGKPIDRKVRAPLSALTQVRWGALTLVQSNVNGLTRHSLLNPGADGPGAGGPGWRHATALLMWLAAAAGIAGFDGAPRALAENLGTVALGSSRSATAVIANVRDRPFPVSNPYCFAQIT
jgi:hypothetical protein